MTTRLPATTLHGDEPDTFKADTREPKRRPSGDGGTAVAAPAPAPTAAAGAHPLPSPPPPTMTRRGRRNALVLSDDPGLMSTLAAVFGASSRPDSPPEEDLGTFAAITAAPLQAPCQSVLAR